MVRCHSEAGDDDAAAGVTFCISIIDDGAVRARGQEDEEREEIQRVIRQREAQEGEEDRANQGQGGSPQVHPLAAPFQVDLI